MGTPDCSGKGFVGKTPLVLLTRRLECAYSINSLRGHSNTQTETTRRKPSGSPRSQPEGFLHLYGKTVTMKRSTNFNGPAHYRNSFSADSIVATLRALGMTDAEIKAEMETRRQPTKPAADSNCPICHGDGYYFEDVAGDGGSRMRIDCECVQTK